MLSSHARKAYILILCIAFFIGILTSFLQVQKEQTTYEEKILKGKGILPSLTICRNHNSDSDNYDTFEDVMDMIEDFKDDIQAKLRVNTTMKISLKNESLLASYGLNFDEMWSYSATIFQDEYPTLIPCTTLNWPFLKFPTDNDLLNQLHNIWLDIFAIRNFSSINTGFYLDWHAPGKSLHNFDFEWGNSFDIVYVMKGYTYVPITVETTKLKLSSFDCYEENLMNNTDCINDFINEELKCQLPWLEEKLPIGLEICSGSEKLKEFRKLYTHLTSTETSKRIEMKGCFKPNCETLSWVKSYTETYDFQSKDYGGLNGTKLWLGLPKSTHTIQRTEILLADFSTFLADFGSYLGLFLGASILSITDLVLLNCKKIFEKLVKCYKN